MKVLLTCGPGYEPIDAVRRLTNHSTGSLGTLLADYFTTRGHTVICLRGSGATAPLPVAARLLSFGTGAELSQALQELSRRYRPAAVLHAAALSDYQVQAVRDQKGKRLPARKKIATADGVIQLELRPAPKIIAQLRGWFPEARLVGWKYELEKGKAAALARGRQQMQAHDLDFCVVNGLAYGRGFGLCNAAGATVHCGGGTALAQRLEKELQQAGLRRLA
jgi:phosphopantothenoylcysteine decarboxylase/phosphopantothenate--cysteine ligase